MDTITEIMMLRPWMHHPFAATQPHAFEAPRLAPRRAYDHLVQDALQQHHLLQQPLQNDTIVIPRSLVLKPVAIRLADVYSAVPLTVSLLERNVAPEYISRLPGVDERISYNHDKYSQFGLGGEHIQGLSPVAFQKAEMIRRGLFPVTQNELCTERMNDIFTEFLNMRLKFIQLKEARVGENKSFSGETRTDAFRTSVGCTSRHADGGAVLANSRQGERDVVVDSYLSSRKHVSLHQPMSGENSQDGRFNKAPKQHPELLQKLNPDEARKSNKRFLTPISNENKFMKKRKPLVEGLLLDSKNEDARERLETSALGLQIATSDKGRENVVNQNEVPVSAEQYVRTDKAVLRVKNSFIGGTYDVSKITKHVESNILGKDNSTDKQGIDNSSDIRGKNNPIKGIKPPRLISSLKTLSVDRKAFKCPQCRYLTDRKNNLKRHVITMHQVSAKMLECCGVAFQSKASLRDHNAVFHRGGYRCQICSRNFCRKALLRRHLTVHSGQKDFFCDLCGYATSHKSNLERHQKVHNKREVSSLVDKRDFYQKRKLSNSSLRSQRVFSDGSSVSQRQESQQMTLGVTNDISSKDKSLTRTDTNKNRSHGLGTAPFYSHKELLKEGDAFQPNLIETSPGKTVF